jgi:hypothetical protein
MTRRLLQLLALAPALCLPGATWADVIDEPAEQPPPRRRVEPAPPPAPAPAAVTDVEGWQFSVLPYFWWSGVDGKKEVPIPADPPWRDSVDAEEIDNEFWEVFGKKSDNLYSGGALMEARKDRLGFFLHPAGGSLEFDEQFDEFGSSAVDVRAFWIEGGVAYRLMESGDPGSEFWLDALAGLRWTHLDTDVRLNRGAHTTVLPEGNHFDDDYDYVDPFIGARARLPLADRLGFTVQSDIGGFDVGSDLSWQVMGLIGYRLDLGGLDSEIFMGYRALDQRYDRSGFTWDVTVHGPVFGMGLHF